MKKLSAIIIDDERPARKELQILLKAFPEIEVIGESDNLSGAVDLIINRSPDVVFLDIQLAGENGFDLLEQVPLTFKLIFVTAYDEYAIRAFEVNATDYLLKPVDPARLEMAIKRLAGNQEQAEPAACKFEYSDLLFVKLSNRTSKFIRLNTVHAIVSMGNYSKLLTGDGRSYFVLKTLKQWEEELPQMHFLRIHRSTIVNLDFIVRIERFSGTCYRTYISEIPEPFEVSRSCASKLRTLNRQK